MRSPRCLVIDISNDCIMDRVFHFIGYDTHLGAHVFERFLDLGDGEGLLSRVFANDTPIPLGS